MSLRDPPACTRGAGVQPAASQTIGLLKDRLHPMAVQKTVGLPFCTALAAVRRATRMLRVNNVPDVFVFFGIRKKSLRDRRSAVQNRSKAVLCFLHPCRKLLRNQPAAVKNRSRRFFAFYIPVKCHFVTLRPAPEAQAFSRQQAKLLAC